MDLGVRPIEVGDVSERLAPVQCDRLGGSHGGVLGRTLPQRVTAFADDVFLDATGRTRGRVEGDVQEVLA